MESISGDGPADPEGPVKTGPRVALLWEHLSALLQLRLRPSHRGGTAAHRAGPAALARHQPHRGPARRLAGHPPQGRGGAMTRVSHEDDPEALRLRAAIAAEITALRQAIP